ncbi:MAG: PilZ domain-containing protein [Polyangia bacterium]
MRTVLVHFPSGKEVLGRYWGMLRNGGLQLLRGDLETPLEDGEPGERVRLVVSVQTLKKTYQFVVKLVDVHGRGGGMRLTLEFLPEEPPDELLDAVWADGCDVPQRRSRRVHVALPVRFTRLDSGTAHDGELRNLSLSGCCIAGRELPREGAQVAVHLPQELLAAQDPSWPPLGGPTEDLTLAGRVRWTERPDDGLMGVEFLRMESRLEPLIDALRTSVVPR